MADKETAAALGAGRRGEWFSLPSKTASDDTEFHRALQASKICRRFRLHPATARAVAELAYSGWRT